MQAVTTVGNLASAIGITTEDATLIADLKAGSEEAFGILIAQYHQPLYSLIARSLSDPADAAAQILQPAAHAGESPDPRADHIAAEPGAGGGVCLRPADSLIDGPC